METMLQMMADKPWVLLGLALGILLRTLVPWLRLRPRPAFDWNALWPALAAVVLSPGPLVAGIDPAVDWWLQLLTAAAASAGVQDTVRKIFKPYQSYNGGKHEN